MLGVRAHTVAIASSVFVVQYDARAWEIVGTSQSLGLFRYKTGYYLAPYSLAPNIGCGESK